MLDSILSFLGGLGTATTAAINWLIAAIATLAGGEIALTKAVGDEQTREQTKWGALIRFLQFGWLLHLGGPIGNLFDAIGRLYGWLKRHIQAIKDFIQYWKDWFDRYYRRYVLPMMNLIQNIRRFLLILRLLHVHFADKLDKWLQQYEMEVNKVFLAIHGTLNQLLDWLTLATNPFSLGRMVLVSVTGRRMAAAITRAITGLPIGHFFPSTSKSAFPWERQPQSSKDYLSETTNPPSSQILLPLLDFLGPSEYDNTVGATDTDIDAAEPLPWGGEFIANVIASEEYVLPDAADPLSIVELLETQAGLLYDAGKGAADALAAAWV